MSEPRNPKRPVSEDVKEIIDRGSRSAGGLFGKAAKGLAGRGRQIDDYVDGAHDRQHTDKANGR